MAEQGRSGREGETKARLLEAGANLFGLHGFEATSTRALAAAAGANLASILYHFGGKEGLYRAVLSQMAETKLAEISPALEAVLSASSRQDAGREELFAALRQFVRTLAGVMLGDPASRSFSQIMMQEQIAPTGAYDILYKGFFARVQLAWAALLSRCTGLPPESMELRLRALSLLGQLVIFRVGMTATLNHLGLSELSPAHLECIVQSCIQQTEAALENFRPVSGELSL